MSRMEQLVAQIAINTAGATPADGDIPGRPPAIANATTVQFANPPAQFPLQPAPSAAIPPTVSTEAHTLNAILETLRSNTATQRGLQSPGLDAPEQEDRPPRPLDSAAMMYRPKEWHDRADDELYTAIC